MTQKPKPKNVHAVKLGRLGGKAATKAQQSARAMNLKKAREKRWVDTQSGL